MSKALVVEDDLDFAERLLASLDSEGMIVSHSANEPSAEDLMIREDFDIILIDLMLPPTYSDEGLVVLRKALSLQPEATVILMTSREERTVTPVAEAMRLGAQDFLDKNDDLVVEKLMARIHQLEAEKRNGVFVSHGHNELLRLKLKNFVEQRLHRRAVVLAEQPSRGMTIVEKLERASVDCSSAVVLLTCDDETAAGGFRPRQNVIHEIGFFQGRYGRKNVVLLVEEGVELFSNISGIVTIEFSAAAFEASFEGLRLELEGDRP
jgi:predicted nucleotide-binding protein